MAASTAPAARPGQPPGGRKSMMRSPVTWVIVLGIALAGGAYLLIRRSRAAAGTTTPTAGTPAGTVSPDWSGEISTLQTEIMDLQSSAAQQAHDEDTDETEKITVPDVVGVSVEQASQILHGAGLTVNAPAGVKGAEHVVTHQAPAAGVKVRKGTAVTLAYRTVSERPKHHPHPAAPQPPPGGKGGGGFGPGGKAAAAAHHVTRTGG